MCSLETVDPFLNSDLGLLTIKPPYSALLFSDGSLVPPSSTCNLNELHTCLHMSPKNSFLLDSFHISVLPLIPLTLKIANFECYSFSNSIRIKDCCHCNLLVEPVTRYFTHQTRLYVDWPTTCLLSSFYQAKNHPRPFTSRFLWASLKITVVISHI